MAQAAIALTAVQVAGQLFKGISANKEARAGARVDEENARLTALQGEQEAMDTRREERGVAGDMIAAMSSGGTLLDGSNADLLAQSVYQREVEIYNIRSKRAAEARNLMSAAKDKRRAGRNALIGAGFSAVATSLGGVSDMRRDMLMASQGERERGATLTGSIKVPVASKGGY